MGWLGLDDTDSLQGGCTTASFHALLADLPNDVKTGVPKLVRLWPFAQRRTRGNAALAVELHAPDEAVLMDHLDNWWRHHLAPLEGAVEASTMSDRPQSPASPGMVYYRERPDEAFYWNAVRQEVDFLSIPTPHRAWGGYGKIGAAAAVSWPAQQVTWEAIAWRSTTESTQSRRIDMNALLEIDGMEGVVLSRDPRNGSGLIAPRGPSPVLFGVRATSFEVAEKACLHLLDAPETEEASAWRVFETNQASGDHLPPVRSFTVVSVETHPARKHAHVRTDGPTVVAYAEGGAVNALARWLQEGDKISVAGLLHPDGTLHAERLKVDSWVHRTYQRPLCSSCLVRMKSMGKGQGLRCPSCKSTAPDTWDGVPVTPPHTGWVEPPMDARRHLARPLSWEDSDGMM